MKFALNCLLYTTLVVFLTGCGNEIPTFPAGGTVKFSDGSPLSAGFVSFRALDHPEHFSARGTIQSDGTFELTTFDPEDGAVAGKHQVLVTTPSPPDRPGFETPASPQVEARFTSYDTSGLEFNVTDDPEQNRFEIEVVRGR